VVRLISESKIPLLTFQGFLNTFGFNSYRIVYVIPQKAIDR